MPHNAEATHQGTLHAQPTMTHTNGRMDTKYKTTNTTTKQYKVRCTVAWLIPPIPGIMMKPPSIRQSPAAKPLLPVPATTQADDGRHYCARYPRKTRLPRPLLTQTCPSCLRTPRQSAATSASPLSACLPHLLTRQALLTLPDCPPVLHSPPLPWCLSLK